MQLKRCQEAENSECLGELRTVFSQQPSLGAVAYSSHSYTLPLLEVLTQKAMAIYFSSSSSPFHTLAKILQPLALTLSHSLEPLTDSW